MRSRNSIESITLDRLSASGSFAALCGVSPIDASSGKTQRRRLNRGGDRQANSALYTITIARLRWDKRTQDYVRRRVAEGKTRREAIAASSATSPARFTKTAAAPQARHRSSDRLLDFHRGIKLAITYRGGVVLRAIILWLARLKRRGLARIGRDEAC